jgi:hypothetical protein
MRHLLPGTIGVLAAGLTGCLSENGSVFIESALVIDPGDECVVQAKSGTLLGAGLFDVLNPSRGYQAALKVRTNLPATFTNADIAIGQTQAPNYPDYGATDNNIIIFNGADINFSFVTDPATAAVFQANEDFRCDDEGSCTGRGSQPLVSGSVFNVNTALSTEAAVFVEAMSAAEAVLFGAAFEDVLSSSDARQRIIANIRVKGTTTGTGQIASFPFPFAIDLCRGCLAPDDNFCGELTTGEGVVAEARPATGDTCFDGQDFPSSFCLCLRQGNGGATTPIGPALNDSCP